MSGLSSNKLVPVGVAMILLSLGGLAAKSLVLEGTATPQPRPELPAFEPAPDGDTPVDTIRTLRAELTTSNDRLSEVIQQNKDLQAANEKLRAGEARIEARLTAQLEEKLAAAKSERDAALKTSTSSLGEQLEALRQSLSVKAAAEPAAPAPGDGYPIANAGVGTRYVWVEPLDAEAVSLEGGGALDLAPEGSSAPLLPGFDPVGAAGPIQAAASTATANQEPEESTAFFTINNLATLAGSTAFTAMIGRVPIDGQIADPVPFRVLVGRENLAASGLRVPDEIAAMVFEGVAIGDWTLGCVEGSLRTATFVFEDGTIRTVEGGGGQDGRLGYVADKFGTPCIAGERVSNAAGYLAASVGLAAGAGAAEAFSAAETAQVIEDGAITSAVVGDVANFALGRAASDATAEIQAYLANRLSNTFDAIYVPPGQEIALLIQEEIAIDYDPNGRKLDHAKGAPSSYRGLD